MTDLVSRKPHYSQSLISPALTRVIMWIMVLAVAAWTLQHIKTTLTVFGLAFLIAYLLNSVVTLLERKYTMQRGKAIALVYVLLFVGVGTVAAVLFPLIINQVNGMVTQLPGLPEKLNALATHVREDYFSRLPEQYQSQFKENIAGGAASAAEAAKMLLVYLRNFVLGLVSAAFLILTSLIVSIFVMLCWHELAGRVLDVMPVSYRQEISNLGLDLHKIFGGYLRATIKLATACGILTFVLLAIHALAIRSNPYLLVITFITMICFPIPLVNQVVPPVSAAILGFINADSSGYGIQLAVLVWLALFIVERTLAPRIMSEAVGVSPLFVLFAAFAGAELLGPVGALLGVPLAAMVKSVFVWFHGRFLTAREEFESEQALEDTPEPVLVATHHDIDNLKREIEQLRESMAILRAEVARAAATTPEVHAQEVFHEPSADLSNPSPQ